LGERRGFKFYCKGERGKETALQVYKETRGGFTQPSSSLYIYLFFAKEIQEMDWREGERASGACKSVKKDRAWACGRESRSVEKDGACGRERSDEGSNGLRPAEERWREGVNRGEGERQSMPGIENQSAACCCIFKGPPRSHVGLAPGQLNWCVGCQAVRSVKALA